MFESFEKRTDFRGLRRLAGAGGVALVLYAGSVFAFVVLGAPGESSERVPEEKKEKKTVEVAFRPPPPPPPPAPPPPPPPAAPPPPAQKPPPRRVARATPPPRPALVAPKEVPAEKPEEKAPPAQAVPVVAEEASDEVEGSGDYEGRVDAPPAPPSPPRPRVARPVHLPENAEPPVALDSNASPEFPADARAKGQEGMVILRLVVSAQGEVQKVELLKGDDPFATAALSAVRTWRYRPARSNGQPIAVFQTVRIPFRLRT